MTRFGPSAVLSKEVGLTRMQKESGVGPTIGTSKEEFSKSILDGYSPSDGCPPLKDHWGGYSLATIRWLSVFSKKIASDEQRKKAWNTLKKKCDTSYIIDLVYAFTRRAEVRVDQNQEEANRTKEALDQIGRASCRERV